MNKKERFLAAFDKEIGSETPDRLLITLSSTERGPSACVAWVFDGSCETLSSVKAILGKLAGEMGEGAVAAVSSPQGMRQFAMPEPGLEELFELYRLRDYIALLDDAPALPTFGPAFDQAKERLNELAERRGCAAFVTRRNELGGYSELVSALGGMANSLAEVAELVEATSVQRRAPAKKRSL